MILKASDVSDDVALTELVLEKTGVALVPGSAFGAAGFIRLSYATSMEQLDSAIDRLAAI